MPESWGEPEAATASPDRDTEVLIDAQSSVDPGVQLRGRVHVLGGTSLGVGAIIVGPKVGTPIRIGPDATVGAGAVVSVVSVGANAIVEPGAVVTQSVPPGAVVGGNPARVLRTRVAFTDRQPLTTSRPPGPRRESVVPLTHVDDMRGSLVAGEAPAGLPFSPARFFVVFDVPGPEVRGEHAHLECGQLLIALGGSIEVICDDGSGPMTYLLDRPDRALHIPPMVWGVQHKYSPHATLLVLASHPYDPGDYIRNFDDFLDMVARRGQAPVSEVRSPRVD